MRNVIPFKRVDNDRLDTLAERVARVELEARLAVAQEEIDAIRARRRELQAEIAWRSIRGMLILAFLLWLMHALAAPAKAAEPRNRSFYGANGNFIGSAVTHGRSTSFYDGSGRFSGTMLDYGRTRSFYDGRGRFTGSEIKR
jgi:hypothetical protein